MTVVNTRIAETKNITENGTYDVARYTTANVNVSAGGKYQLLQRVTDDSNNPVGIVVGFYKDSSNNEYAVVVIDKAYRGDNYVYSMVGAYEGVWQATGLPAYNNNTIFDNTETATHNCDIILNAVTSLGTTSKAITYTRGISFVIDGVTYYGQVPTLKEMLCALSYRSTINTLDPSASGSIIDDSQNFWTATFGSTGNFSYTGGGVIKNNSVITQSKYILPILELPNA